MQQQVYDVHSISPVALEVLDRLRIKAKTKSNGGIANGNIDDFVRQTEITIDKTKKFPNNKSFLEKKVCYIEA